MLHALRLDSCLLILFGIANQLFHSISFAVAFGVSSLPIVFAVISSVIKKPEKIAVANIVDQRLATRGLLMTSIELLQSGSKVGSDFAPWIIRQAAQTATLQVNQLSSAVLCKPLKKPWLELSALLLGIFLVLQPEKINPVSLHASPLTASDLSKGEVRVAKTNLMAEIRKANLVDKPENPSFSNSPAESVAAVENKSTFRPPSNSRLDKAAKIPEPTALDDDPSLNASASAFSKLSQHDHQAAVGIGYDSDNAPSTKDYETHLNAQINYLPVPVQDGELVNENNGTVPYSDYRVIKRDRLAKLPSSLTVGKSSASFNGALSFGQQHYVSLFFTQAHPKK